VFNSSMLHMLRVKMVINSPWMLSKNWLVQKQTALGQTATGEESSNPFMAGVNTPRSDEDRLKIMELMAFLLQKGVYGETGITAAHLSSYCCQANVSAVCSKFYMYPRFIQLIIQAQVGDLSTHTICFISPALTQKVFANMRMVGKGFSGVETPLFKSMIDDRQPTEEELGAEQVQVDAEVDATVVEDVIEDVTEDVSHVATPSPPPHGIPSPPQEPFSPPQQPHVTPPAPTQSEAFPVTFQQVLDTCSALLLRVDHLEHDNVAQRLEIVKLKARVKKLEKTDKIKSSKLRRLRKVGASRKVESSDDMEDVFNQGRMINEDEGIELVKDAEIAESEGRQADKQAEIYNIDLDHSLKVLIMQEDDSEVQEVVEVVTTAKLITEVVTAAASQVSAASTTIPAASATFPAANPTIYAAAPTVVAAYTRRRKGVIIRDPEEELSLKTSETPVETPKEEIDRDHDRFNKDVDWDAAMDHVNQKSSTKRRKLSEEAQEAEDLRKRLEVVEDEDDDVFVEATPLASKIPVVDYQIVLIDNKPRFKIIRADETH
nr:hypothetical protein [Tanacetum cinerariifolium]